MIFVLELFINQKNYFGGSYFIHRFYSVPPTQGFAHTGLLEAPAALLPAMRRSASMEPGPRGSGVASPHTVPPTAPAIPTIPTPGSPPPLTQLIGRTGRSEVPRSILRTTTVSVPPTGPAYAVAERCAGVEGGGFHVNLHVPKKYKTMFLDFFD